MKNEILARLFLVCFLFLPTACFAQIDWRSYTATTFKSGFTIADHTEITPKLPQNSAANINGKPTMTSTNSEAADGNVIYRVFKDSVNKIYIGYDFEVKESTEKGKFTVLIKPLSSEAIKKSAEKENLTMQKLPNYPDAIEVGEGDTIALTLMENPTTKQKFIDYVKIFKSPESMNDYLAGEGLIHDFTLDDVELNLSGCEVFADNQSILKVGGGAFGSIVWLYLKDRGRFIFSLFPHPGYNFQKIGEISGNRIMFKYNDVNYKIHSSQPIVGNGGHWNLWVLYDANYKSEYGANAPYTIGGADKAEFLFPKQ